MRTWIRSNTTPGVYPSRFPGHPQCAAARISIQYKLTNNGPGSILSVSYGDPHVSSFNESLLATLRTLPGLKCIKLSLPHAYRSPYSTFLDALVDSVLADPKILPTTETVDLTHTYGCCMHTLKHYNISSWAKALGSACQGGRQ